MGKGSFVVYGVLFTCVFACSSFLRADIRQKVAGVYSAEIGVRERTGNNDGDRVEMYLKSCGFKKGQPWCAAFVTWTFQQAGVETVISAYSPSWFPAKKVIYTHGSKQNLIPVQADVFGIYFSSKGRIAHVGFIDQWAENSSFCITVEGNTNKPVVGKGMGFIEKED